MRDMSGASSRGRGAEAAYYFLRLAAAFVRGTLVGDPVRDSHQPLFSRPLEALSEAELAEAGRVPRRFVLLPGPAQTDDEPAHVHRLDRVTLHARLGAHGARHDNCGFVLNHWIGVSRLESA